MINKIKRLKTIGKFYDYAAAGVGLDWGKNTFVIAPNAYGKSTLVNVLRSMRENDPKILKARKTLRSAGSPQAVIIVDGENRVFNGTKWDKPIPEIQIFDVPFIHDNILSHEIGYEHKKSIHKIIIGAQGVKLANDLSELKADEKSKKQGLESLKANFAKGGFVHHTLDAFLAIPAEEEAAVPARIQQLQQDIKSKESEDTIQRLGFPGSLSSPAFDLTTTKALASRKLAALHEDAQKRVLDQIDRNIKDKEAAKEFIRLGLELLQADCPFCGQDLNNAALLMKAYQEFFDDAFRTYQKELEEKAESLSTWNLDNALTTLVSKHHANTVVLKQWEPFIGIETLPDVTAVVDAARTKVIDLKTKVHAELEKKRKDPTTEADISQLDSLASELASLQFSVEAYNQAVAAFTEKGKAYVSNLAKSNIESIRAALEKEREVEKRFSPEWLRRSSEMTHLCLPD